MPGLEVPPQFLGKNAAPGRPLGLTDGALVAPLLRVNLPDVNLQHVGPAGRVVTVGTGVGSRF